MKNKKNLFSDGIRQPGVDRPPLETFQRWRQKQWRHKPTEPRQPQRQAFLPKHPLRPPRLLPDDGALLRRRHDVAAARWRLRLPGVRCFPDHEKAEGATPQSMWVFFVLNKKFCFLNFPLFFPYNYFLKLDFLKLILTVIKSKIYFFRRNIWVQERLGGISEIHGGSHSFAETQRR